MRTETVSWTRKEVFDLLSKELKSDLDEQVNILAQSIPKRETYFIAIPQASREKLKKMLCTLKSKWKEAGYIRAFFFKKNASWLKLSTEITVKYKTCIYQQL